MSCCGRPRAPAETRYPPWRERPPPEPHFRPPMVTFVYTGATQLVVEGPVSRRRYRFEHPGALVEVDGRDAASLAAVPNLRRRGRS
jgi:hypothetical protein